MGILGQRSHSTAGTLRVAVLQQVLPHYRAALFTAMDRSERVDYTFFASGSDFAGIVHLDTDVLKRFERAPFSIHLGLYYQWAAVRIALRREFDALIFLGNPYYVPTWIGTAIARLRGVPVLFWAHGWLREKEEGIKLRIREAFFRLADRMLVYSERGKALGEAAGYPADRITVIYNSLDLDRADATIARIEDGSLATDDPRRLFPDPARPLIICTARITKLCRFDLLIEAAALLRDRGSPVNLLLVGDGPEREGLMAAAAERGLDAIFPGACYDEERLGQFLYHADLTVSPGKIGLTAIHSLMYGTPAITHGNLDAQMPEVEVLLGGGTGALFRQDDSGSLADAIADWLASQRDRTATRAACRALVRAKWSPHAQARIMENAVIELVGARRAAAAA